MTLLELADEIRALDIYGAADADATTETIADEIRENPQAVIEWLIDFIKEN